MSEQLLDFQSGWGSAFQVGGLKEVWNKVVWLLIWNKLICKCGFHRSLSGWNLFQTWATHQGPRCTTFLLPCYTLLSNLEILPWVMQPALHTAVIKKENKTGFAPVWTGQLDLNEVEGETWRDNVGYRSLVSPVHLGSARRRLITHTV